MLKLADFHRGHQIPTITQHVISSIVMYLILVKQDTINGYNFP